MKNTPNSQNTPELEQQSQQNPETRKSRPELPNPSRILTDSVATEVLGSDLERALKAVAQEYDAINRETAKEHPDVAQIAEKAKAALDRLHATAKTDIDRKTLSTDTETQKLSEIHERVRLGKLPLPYDTNQGVYGYKTKVDGNYFIYEKGFTEKVLDTAEGVLMSADDLGWTALHSYRRKATVKEISARIKELGLEQRYQTTANGFRENINNYQNEVSLDDLLRYQGQPGYEALSQVNILDGIQQAAKLAANIHTTKKNYIGQFIANDILLNVKDKQNPATLTLPDVISDNKSDILKKQATDLMDMCFSLGSAGLKNNGATGAENYINHFLESYSKESKGNFTLIALKSLLESGMPKFNPLHNKMVYGFDRINDPQKAFEEVRALTLKTLIKKTTQNNSQDLLRQIAK